MTDARVPREERREIVRHHALPVDAADEAALAAAGGAHAPPGDPCALPARKAGAIIVALGGKANIVRVDACAQTRIRLVVKDIGRVSEANLRSAGIAAMVKVDGDKLHLLSDLNADQYAAEMRGQLAT